MTGHKSLKTLPGPAGLPVLGSLLTLVSEPVSFFMSASREYGRIVPIRLGMSTALLLNRPEQIEHVLQRNYRNYPKAKLVAKLKPIMGEGLLTADGELWMQQRRLMQPAFHRRRIENLFGEMTAVIRERSANWTHAADTGEPLDLMREMTATTVSVVVRTMFGADIGDRVHTAIRAIESLQLETPKRVFALTPLREWVPNPAKTRFDRALRDLDEIVYDIIRMRRDTPVERDDLLSLLMEATDADTNERMNDRQLRDEVMTMFAAGHETTSNALSWTLTLLAQHPDVLAELREEIEGALDGREPAVDDLSHLPLTTAVINEALRLYPPIWWTSRVAAEDDLIEGYHVPKGTIVLISPWTIHRHPEVWDAPDEFRPWRFLAENDRRRHKFAFLPFGAGPRVCIGSGFAMMEMKLILARLLPRFAIDLQSEAQLALGPYLTLKPHGRLAVTVRHRRPSQRRDRRAGERVAA